MYKNHFAPFVTQLNRFLFLVSIIAVVTLIAQYGFYLPRNVESWLNRIDVFIVWFFVVQAFLKLIFAQNVWGYLKSRWFDYLLAFLILSETAFLVNLTGFRLLGRYLGGGEVTQITKLYIVAFQISILFTLVVHAVRFNQRIAFLQVHPAQLLIGSFLVVILIGTGLLLLPRSVAQGNHLSLIDALFTATSATCVTGLIVVNTGTYFSKMGQIIILVLIQIGGLGLMTYASFFTLVLRRSISIREKFMLKEILNYENIGYIGRLLLYTVLFTLIMESLGAGLFYFSLEDIHPQLNERIFSAVFHSVSAFCNAGFSLYSTSFIHFKNNYLTLFTLMGLIILGGLGFPVLLNLSGFRLRPGQIGTRYLTVQTRMVFFISASLLVLGTVVFYLIESQNILIRQPWPQRLIHSFFQSVTSRTAGFNTVNIGEIAIPTAVFLMFLMFIGASPGSTGGGIKTTTFGILTAGVWSVIKGRNRIEMYHKTIPFTVLNRAIVIAFFSIFFIFLTTLILSITESKEFIDLLFEAFSAYGTVGLSRGVTADLSPLGRIIIILTMFIGRLGALTISLAITTPREVHHYDYPAENVMVG